jgi:AcrR family transcriptional regulator
VSSRGAAAVRARSRGLAGNGAPRAHVAEIQRSRLLTAAVAVIDELGFMNVTIGHVIARARVSRRTFYELFANLEELLTALLEEVVELIQRQIAGAGLADLAWRERVRGSLWIILASLDREPALARVCVVQALSGGPGVLERREELLARLAAVVDEGRREASRGERECLPLTAEGLVGAAFAIVYSRLLRREREPLTSLQGELMGMIVLPYLGPEAARHEQARPALAEILGAAPRFTGAEDGSLDGVQMRLTYRTALVLASIARHPGASNRLVGDLAGVSDPGQISRLLARLERLGLLANAGEGQLTGEPNVWTLTSMGEQVARNIHLRTPHVRPSRRA